MKVFGCIWRYIKVYEGRYMTYVENEPGATPIRFFFAFVSDKPKALLKASCFVSLHCFALRHSRISYWRLQTALGATQGRRLHWLDLSVPVWVVWRPPIHRFWFSVGWKGTGVDVDTTNPLPICRSGAQRQRKNKNGWVCCARPNASKTQDWLNAQFWERTMADVSRSKLALAQVMVLAWTWWAAFLVWRSSLEGLL